MGTIRPYGRRNREPVHADCVAGLQAHTAAHTRAPQADGRAPSVEITAVRDLLWLAFTAAALWGVYALRRIFIPVFIALVLAYLANPVIRTAERRWSWRRPLTVSLFLLLFTAATAAVIAVLGPLVSDQVQTLMRKLPAYGDWLTHKISAAGRLSEHMQSLLSGIMEDPLSLLQPLFAGTGQAFGFLGIMVGATVNAALLMFLLPLYFFFFAWQFDRMLETLTHFIPRSRRPRVAAVLQRMDAAVSGFFRERLLIALMTGVLYAAGWAWTGVPYWFLLGIGTGILSLVPYISAVGWPLAVLFKYLDSLTATGAAADWMSIILWPSAAYLVVQFVESWILTPWLQRRSSDMNAVTLVIVLFIGGAIGGLLGLIFAIPVAACLKIAFEELVLPRWTKWAAEH